MKKLLLFFGILLSFPQVIAQSLTITEQSGWFESAFIKWTPAPGVDSYNVYYSGQGNTNQIIDTQLIRSYGTYFRADILGLQPGTYSITVKPVTANVESEGTTVENITVMPHDRNGFAHSNGRVPGAYNLNGTLKNNAVVIYVTQNNKNTISMNVTGANSNPCVGLQNILDGFKKGQDLRPLAIRLIGNITDLDYMLNGDLVIENKNIAASSITFEGVGSDAIANGWGLRLKKASNVEVRNLGFMLTDASEGDNVSLQQDNEYIWVHHCDFFYGAPGGDADQAKGDGALDCKRSTYVTNSYNHFWDSGKCNLLGLSENTTTGLYVTYHHNWYDHSDSRHPRVRFYSAHVYNNYFDGNSKYGAGSTRGSSIFMEGNLFRSCKYPMLTSKQGTDIFNGAPGTFSGEDGGTIKAFNNEMTGQQRFIAYHPVNYPIEFDAYVATSRNELVPNSVTSKQGGNTYNNFDTNPSLYVNSLVIDSPTDARDKIMQYSGRVGGGDIDFTFNNAVDDPSYAVNTALMSLLTNYTSGLVFVQGDATSTISSQTLQIPSNNDQYVDEGASIEEMVFMWGGDAEGATVSGLPASGIDYTVNQTEKTITVFGSPTDNVSFTVTTFGSLGTSVSGVGNVSINGLPIGDQIHNFTLSGLNSDFYTFASANMNSNAGSTTFEGLTLTARLKIESATVISYTTTSESILTLVFDSSFNGTIKLDNVSYTASNGVAIIPSVAAGNHQITKGSTTNLFYIRTEFVLSNETPILERDLVLYPNPVTSQLHISSSEHILIEQISVYDLTGKLIKNITNDFTTIDFNNVANGSYFIKIQTDKGMVTRKLVKI